MMSDNPIAADADNARPPWRWVIFACAGERLAIRLERVREIVTPRPFTRLPGAVPEAAGLIGVRSRVVTCFDLGRVLGAGPSSERPEHRTLLVDAGERVYGLVVDEVLAVAALDALVSQTAAPPGLALARGQWEGVATTALDPDAIFERLAKRPDQERADLPITS